MSNQEKDQKLSSVTTTTEGATRGTDASMKELTPEEEKVVRMLHGLSEDDSRALEFGLGAEDEASMKLARIEHQLVELMSGGVEPRDADDERPTPAELLSSWIDG